MRPFPELSDVSTVERFDIWVTEFVGQQRAALEFGLVRGLARNGRHALVFLERSKMEFKLSEAEFHPHMSGFREASSAGTTWREREVAQASPTTTTLIADAIAREDVVNDIPAFGSAHER
jgi:hypothetical protein